ncbi:Magnesium transporter protein [Echinococcus granulosus]|uniref:Magnesium transporter protein n=1 Tax=Echinococcus granulosus TaxID=6210 RepID=W6UGN4_ECHGR|nr:Magnesium transporter protein [Echinococcus granulosus]EUB60146.1 Magnesium transporter protein [Echinococcus granulosus]
MVCRMHIVLFRIFMLCLTFGFVTPDTKSLDDRIFALKTAPRDNDLIIVNMEFFEECVLSSPRNYSFVLLVGTKGESCDHCKPAIAALSNVARQWNRLHPNSSEIFFGFVDFVYNLELLQVKTAPFVLFFGRHASIGDCDRTSHPQIVATPALIAAWISKISDINVEAAVSRDFSILLPIACVLLFCAVLKKFTWLRNTKFIASLCLTFICSMCSGLMWVVINSMPFVALQDGKVVYFYPENRAQFGCECLLIVLFYAMISGGLIFLTTKCSKFRKNTFMYSIRVLVGVGVAVLGFNQMAEYYTLKAGYLPFHFSFL